MFTLNEALKIEDQLRLVISSILKLKNIDENEITIFINSLIDNYNKHKLFLDKENYNEKSFITINELMNVYFFNELCSSFQSLYSIINTSGEWL